MAVIKPYYGPHQIIAGKYTPGNEYVYDNGSDFIGAFHILPNGQMFTGSQPTTKSLQIFEKRSELSEDVKVYNRIRRMDVGKYISPILYQPIPTNDEYMDGKFQRYFIQKRNTPETSVMEIDAEQYNNVNVDNNPGINGILWKKDSIVWYISLINIEDAEVLNRIQLEKLERNLLGVRKYLSNLLEFYRK